MSSNFDDISLFQNAPAKGQSSLKKLEECPSPRYGAVTSSINYGFNSLDMSSYPVCLIKVSSVVL